MKHSSKEKSRKVSESSSEESSNLISLYNSLDDDLIEYERVVLSEAKVEKPSLPCTINSLIESQCLFDTGTHIDLIDEEALKKVRRANKEKGNTNKSKYTPCSIKIKGAGGKQLEVVGKVFLTIDLGQGVVFRAIFVIVANLGVPLLIGRRTMKRVKLNICFSEPVRLESHQNGEKKIFPLDQQLAQIVNAYLTMYGNSETDAIHRTESTNANLRNPIFDGREEEKVPNSR
jgi:hypothetical protein